MKEKKSKIEHSQEDSSQQQHTSDSSSNKTRNNHEEPKHGQMLTKPVYTRLLKKLKQLDAQEDEINQNNIQTTNDSLQATDQ